MKSISVLVLCMVAVSIGVSGSHAGQASERFAIRRETESQARERLMRAVSKSNLQGQPISVAIPPASIREVLVPGNDRDVALAVEHSDAFPGFNRVVQYPRWNVSTPAAQRSNLASEFSLSGMRENRGFRKSATTQHQRSGNNRHLEVSGRRHTLTTAFESPILIQEAMFPRRSPRRA
jgi:hypothetical protein